MFLLTKKKPKYALFMVKVTYINSVNKYSPWIVQCAYIYVLGIPEVYVDQTDFIVKFKSSFTLSCNITAHPKVQEIRWIKLKDGKEEIIQNSSKYCGVKTVNLTINDVEDNDEGKYICKARNTLGTGQSKLITLKVIGGEIYIAVMSTYVRTRY